MKQLFEELAEDGTATDSESPFNIITSLNEVLKSDKVGVTNIKYIQTNLSAWFSFNLYGLPAKYIQQNHLCNRR